MVGPACSGKEEQDLSPSSPVGLSPRLTNGGQPGTRCSRLQRVRRHNLAHTMPRLLKSRAGPFPCFPFPFPLFSPPLPSGERREKHYFGLLSFYFYLALCGAGVHVVVQGPEIRRAQLRRMFP